MKILVVKMTSLVDKHDNFLTKSKHTEHTTTLEKLRVDKCLENYAKDPRTWNKKARTNPCIHRS